MVPVLPNPMLRASQPAPPRTAGDVLAPRPGDTRFASYALGGSFDELFDATGAPRPHYCALLDELIAASPPDLRGRQIEADKAFLAQGITFTVDGDDQPNVPALRVRPTEHAGGFAD